MRRRARRAARDPRARPAGQRARRRATGSAQRFERAGASIRSSATSGARGCSRRSSSCATGRPRNASPMRRPSAPGSGRRALAHGLLCRFDPHWIAFGPPLVVTAEQIDEMVGDPRPQPRRGAAELKPARRTASGRADRSRMRPMIPHVRRTGSVLDVSPVRDGTCSGNSAGRSVVFTTLVIVGGLILHLVLRPRATAASPGPATPSS